MSGYATLGSTWHIISISYNLVCDLHWPLGGLLYPLPSWELEYPLTRTILNRRFSGFPVWWDMDSFPGGCMICYFWKGIHENCPCGTSRSCNGFLWISNFAKKVINSPKIHSFQFPTSPSVGKTPLKTPSVTGCSGDFCGRKTRPARGTFEETTCCSVRSVSVLKTRDFPELVGQCKPW